MNIHRLRIPWVLATSFVMGIAMLIYGAILVMNEEGLINKAQAFAQTVTQNPGLQMLIRVAWILGITIGGMYIVAFVIVKLSKFLWVKITGDPNLILK